MIYGVFIWLIVLVTTLFAKTAAYVSEESRNGVGRLVALVVGTILLAVGVIIGLKIIIGTI